jgi:hypothetical protein
MAMGVTTIAGLRLAATPTPPPAKRTALQLAAQESAASRAAGFVAAGFSDRHGVEELTRLLQGAVDLSDYGSSHGTRKKDETAWLHWQHFAELIGFNPVLSDSQVRSHPSMVATLLATFLLHVYPKMKGKNGRQWAKPRSAFAYVLAIIRIFRGWKILLPPAKVVKGELHGLLRAFVNVYGVHALMPNRREPMKYKMVRALLDLPMGQIGSRAYKPTSCFGTAFRGMLAVGWRTGHRLAEFVAHPSGELCYLTRGSVTWVIAGVSVVDPTPAQLRALRPGDLLLIEPPRSKTDQFGEIHCPFPSSLAYSTDQGSAGYLLQQLELERPCRGAARATTPLFADEHGQPYTHGVMDTFLTQALTYLYDAKVASCHSWHSLRIGLATALKAAGCDDAIIQMICRWMNPDSLRAYARHGHSLHINWVDQAERAIIDTKQTTNTPKVCNSEGNAALSVTFGAKISARAQAVLDAAEEREIATGNDAPVEAANLTALIATACIGRRVLVPKASWPAEKCDEHNGAGWEATIVACQPPSNVATVQFLHAATARGVPFKNVKLLMSTLTPL